jgi:CxxC motif-containing protein
LIESLNEKYKGLDTNQKNLLKEYINNISNTNSLNKLITSEIENVKSQLTECLVKIDNDIIKIKINEVVKQLNNVKPSSNVKDNQIMVLLLSYELLKEIKNKL